MTYKTPSVYDRVYLHHPGKTLVLEYIDGDLGEPGSETYVDCWRLIDISTGEVFAEGVNLYDVIGEASTMTCESIDDYDVQSGNYTFIPGRPPQASYRVFKDLPLSVRMKWITSHALDLEHDFKLDGDTRDPIVVATQEMNDMYNEKPCFYLDRKTGKWELDPDIC